jgi:hypothetical protein
MPNTNTQPTVGRQSGSSAAESSRQLRAGSGTLLSLIGFNNGPDQFIQLHDKAGDLASGDVPIFSFGVPANQPFSMDVPIQFAHRVHVANSTTFNTLTPGAADCWFLGRVL